MWIIFKDENEKEIKRKQYQERYSDMLGRRVFINSSNYLITQKVDSDNIYYKCEHYTEDMIKEMINLNKDFYNTIPYQTMKLIANLSNKEIEVI